ncbi:hypothetical protein VTK73DRAFT_9950 [Phialemonium thermophilum]|uniref:Cytochrome P450 n=1 Tax=Phialemonium thermophilum TaxID=223376 RepID=A0ABR3XIC1_9PEZI
MAITVDMSWVFDYVGCIAVIGLLYFVLVGVWRLHLSPISHTPGPRLAAMTWAYEFYYDAVLGGKYTFKIIDLHRQYGPVVRINPDEVHVGDPDFYSVLYGAPDRRRQKWKIYTKQFCADESTLSTIDHDRHKLRRAAMEPYFSKLSVRRLQHVIEERVDALLDRFQRLQKESLNPRQPIDLKYPFSAFTNDVINEYAFARCDHLVEDPSFGKAITDNLLVQTRYGKWNRHIDVILKLVKILPESISRRVIPGMDNLLKTSRDMHAQIYKIKASGNTAKWKDGVDRATVFHELMASNTLPHFEKTLQRLTQEAQTIQRCGILTTSRVLTLATLHLLYRPSALRRLRLELIAAMPDPHVTVPLGELEQLPYLRAVVREALRLSAGTNERLTRVCPDEDLIYYDSASGKEYVIPAGAALSMTTYKTVMDPELFPDPGCFYPERWLEDGRVQRRQPPRQCHVLEKYLTVFGGGTRQCLGLDLAYAEIYLVIAKLFRVWGNGDEDDNERPLGEVGVIRLVETTPRGCQLASDSLTPFPYRVSDEIQVIFEAYD